MTEGSVEFVPEIVVYLWIVLESGVVTVVERCDGSWNLTFPIQNGNQHMLFVVCKFCIKMMGYDTW